MCFDYDWYAEVQEEFCEPASGLTRCDECAVFIYPDERFVRLHLQQFEECLHCSGECPCDRVKCPCLRDENGDCICDELCGADGVEHDYGETFDYNCCLDCDSLIKAIQRHKIPEGCKPFYMRPAFGKLYEVQSSEYESVPKELFITFEIRRLIAGSEYAWTGKCRGGVLKCVDSSWALAQKEQAKCY